MQDHKSHLTIEELSEQVNIPVRTIRYYIAEGLLPGPEGRGKATAYGEEHLQRLRLIRLLANRHMPLAEMSRLLNRLSLNEVHMLLAEEEQRAQELERISQQPQQPQEYIATLLKNARAVRQAPPEKEALVPPPYTPILPPSPAPAGKIYEAPRIYLNEQPPASESWTRWRLAPGIELHVREDAEKTYHGLLERICKIAGIPFQRSHK